MGTRTTAFRIYLSALALGFRAIARGLLREGLSVLTMPVGYCRFLPNAYVLREFMSLKENPRVLDVASPKLLSILLASKTSARVFATDLDDEKIFTRWQRIASSIGLRNYVAEYQDARQLTYPDESFDFVYSISVIEHIPDGGDRQALREFWRVLKPNGVLVIEVPYRRQGGDVFARQDSKGQPIKDLRFYQRTYDAGSLQERLMSNGFCLEKRLILGEWLPVDSLVSMCNLPRPLRLAVRPLEPMLAALNYWSAADDSAGRPLAALLVYRKKKQFGAMAPKCDSLLCR